MEVERLKKILENYRKGKISQRKVLKELQYFPYKEVGFSKIDTHRNLKFGFPEVIYGAGKSISQIERIVREMLKKHSKLIITKIGEEVASELIKKFPSLRYYREAKIVSTQIKKSKKRKYICVVSAGTSDIPVAEEASVVAEILGNRVVRIYDAGVAGLHRLLDKIEILNGAECLIVVAGMEGALPSVVGGIVGKPVIAVPTSVGYGTNFKGITPLLTMLNSCSPNVVVVNIDNGFGAAFFAHLIANK